MKLPVYAISSRSGGLGRDSRAFDTPFVALLDMAMLLVLLVFVNREGLTLAISHHLS